MFNRPIERAFKKAIAARIQDAEKRHKAARKSLWLKFKKTIHQLWLDLQTDRQEALDSAVKELLGK